MTDGVRPPLLDDDPGDPRLVKAMSWSLFALGTVVVGLSLALSFWIAAG